MNVVGRGGVCVKQPLPGQAANGIGLGEMKDLLLPLTERAAATAALQGRRWLGPEDWPSWSVSQRAPEDHVVAEIIANLLENAFRYSPANAPLGLLLSDDWICVWDGGPAIAAAERERIFQQGVRGSCSQDQPGSGIGLALARRYAEGRPDLINPCLTVELEPGSPQRLRCIGLIHVVNWRDYIDLQESLTLAFNQLIYRVDLSHFVLSVSYDTTDQQLASIPGLVRGIIDRTAGFEMLAEQLFAIAEFS